MIQTTTTKITYIGDGNTTEWEYPFPISTTDGSDIQVWITPPDGIDLRIDTNYSVNVNHSYVKYPIDLDPPLPKLPVGYKITLARVSTITQLLDLVNQGAFDAENIEDALDKLTMICQQLQEQVARSLKVGVTENEGNPDTLMEQINNAVKYTGEAQEAAEEAQGKAEEAQGKAEEAQGKAEEAQATLENIIPYITIKTDVAELTPDGSKRENEIYISALAQDFELKNPSGSASAGNTIVIQITATGDDRDLTWGNGYVELYADLPIEVKQDETIVVMFAYFDGAWNVMSVLTL